MPRMLAATLRRLLGTVPVVLGLGLLAGCNNSDNGGTIINNNGLDCGLVRADLTGTWRVIFSTANRTLVNCDNASFDNATVSVSSSALDFSNVVITGSEFAASFLVTADGSDPQQATELVGSVQADSCLALIKVWSSSNDAYFACLGTFDIATRSISAGCDSADVDSPVDGAIDATCDLNSPISVAVDIL